MPAVTYLETTWLARLCSPRIAVRKINTSDWYVAIGDICSVVVKLWPLKLENGVYLPVVGDDSVAVTETIHDECGWLAMPLAPFSPLRRACMQQVASTGYFTGSLVQVLDSHTYGKLTIAAVSTEPPRWLIEVACREAFWDLPCNYLRKLAEYLEPPLIGTDVFGLITSIGTHQIPIAEQTDTLWASIYLKREITFEFDEDLEELCDLEYVLDAFDEGDKQSLETELKSAKVRCAERGTFRQSVCE